MLHLRSGKKLVRIYALGESSAVCREGHFVLGEVSNDDTAMLELGHCRAGSDEKKQNEAYVRLSTTRPYDDSCKLSTPEGKVIFGDTGLTAGDQFAAITNIPISFDAFDIGKRIIRAAKSEVVSDIAND